MAATEHDHEHEAHDHAHDHDHDHGHDHGERRSKKEIEREARARARELVARSQIRQYPEPVLREPAREVGEFSEDLRALVERMMRLMDDANGVGLAGNQVGLLRRVLVYRPDREDAEPRALVNPTIAERSEELATDEEGCLSLGPLRVPVERHVRVSVEARDENGEPVRVDAENLEARILQHEIDHLDGVLIIDRTSPEARREALAALRPLPGPRR
ncbi:MAG: peptide deformylase [Gaiellales bacterium]|jgi:peptide deformylase|nr:peptide deformylase [Gaiellales bacterium]